MGVGDAVAEDDCEGDADEDDVWEGDTDGEDVCEDVADAELEEEGDGLGVALPDAVMEMELD